VVHALSPGGAHELGPENGMAGAGREPAEPEAAASAIGSASVLGARQRLKNNGQCWFPRSVPLHYYITHHQCAASFARSVAVLHGIVPRFFCSLRRDNFFS